MKIIRLNELSEMLGVSRSTIYRWRNTGVLPEAFELSHQVVAWDRRDIENWLYTTKNASI